MLGNRYPTVGIKCRHDDACEFNHNTPGEKTRKGRGFESCSKPENVFRSFQ